MYIPSQLESALVLELRTPIKWEAAVEAPSAGTLTPVDAEKPFDPHDYLQRDRELMWRDLVTGAAVLETSIQVSNVYLADTYRPRMQGPVDSTLPLDRAAVSSTGTNLSMVRHVHNASIPLDAAQFADSDLYGRDALVYEVLARACQHFLHPPLVPIDLYGTLVSLNGSSAWSLAEGLPTQADINPAMTLNRDAFRNADRHLADRDNQLAAYAARLAQVLKNPFAYAMRLYVRVLGTPEYEAETYVLVSDDGIERIWRAEPGLNDRFQIVYNVADKTLQWTCEQTDSLHVPQIYAMSIPGIEPNQVLNTLPEVPDPQDCQYWRHKASQVIPEGQSLTDTASFLTWTAGSVGTAGPVAGYGASGGILQPDGASLTVPGVISFALPGHVTGKPANTAFAQNYRVAILAQPNSRVEVTGGQNISSTNGTLGGATWELDVTTIGAKEYVVSGGDGIVYNGETYWPGSSFKGIASVTSYSQVNALFPSTVRQQACYWSMALPPGPWSLQLEYTNLGAVTAGFGVQVTYASGANAVDVIQDATPLPYTGQPGELRLTEASYFDVVSPNETSLGVFWNYGDGQFHVRRIIIDSLQVSSGSYAIDCKLATGTASVNVTGLNKLTETMLWEIPVTGNHEANVRLNWSDAPSCPVRFKQVQVQLVGSYAPTPNSFLFGGWRQECLDRAEKVIQQGYAATIASYGTNIETQCPACVITAAQEWNRDDHAVWMGLVEVRNPRLRDMEDIAGYGIMPGRQYEVTSGLVIYGGRAYEVGSKFYGTDNDGNTYTGGVVKQIGALMQAKPGHIGLPCLMPDGIYLESDGVARARLPVAYATPRFVACQAWMVELGAYVVQEEFWMPEFYDKWDSDVQVEAERVMINTAVSPAGAGTVTPGGLKRVGSIVTLSTTPSTDPNYTYTFQNWTDSTGLVVSTDASFPVLVVDPQTYTANYLKTATTYLITFAISPVGGGTITNGVTGLYPYGTVLVLTANPNPTLSAADVAADICFVIDESGSMSDEQAWIAGIAPTMDAALQAVGIGTQTRKNRFALYGFGATATAHHLGHSHLFGSNVWLSADHPTFSTTWANPDTALVTSGGAEDAYEPIDDVSSNAFGWRTTNVAKVIIFATDEDRQEHNYPSSITTLRNKLGTGDFIVAGILRVTRFYDYAGTQVIGYGYGAQPGYAAAINGLCYIADGFGGFTYSRTGNATDTGAEPQVTEEYVNLCIHNTVRGSVWDLAYIRATGIPTASFSAAFVDNMKDRIIATLGWRFINWTSGATVLGSSANLIYTVDGPDTVTANFQLVTL